MSTHNICFHQEIRKIFFCVHSFCASYFRKDKTRTVWKMSQSARIDVEQFRKIWKCHKLDCINCKFWKRNVF